MREVGRAGWLPLLACLICAMVPLRVAADQNVYLTDVPDYDWWRGCFGTATGNLMGFWDRHGYPNFYTGPTAGGVAPLDSFGFNHGIRSLWASRAGFDGRPPNLYGHDDDYWVDYDSTDPDPYIAAGRPEHSPDCLGDFIGLNQFKWPSLNGECAGNIDGYSFTFWDAAGNRRINYVPPSLDHVAVRDIPSGLRAWTAYRGSRCDVFGQLADFNPLAPAGHGFTFNDLKAEIDAGYPVLLFLQPFAMQSRSLGPLSNANPFIHGMLAYGYYLSDSGDVFVRFRDSWAGGDQRFSSWTADVWVPLLPVRGVIGYHPLPRITGVQVNNGQTTLAWEGPAAQLYDAVNGTVRNVHWYIVESAATLDSPHFVAVSGPLLAHQMTLAHPETQAVFYRVRLAGPTEIPTQ